MIIYKFISFAHSHAVKVKEKESQTFEKDIAEIEKLRESFRYLSNFVYFEQKDTSLKHYSLLIIPFTVCNFKARSLDALIGFLKISRLYHR